MKHFYAVLVLTVLIMVTTNSYAESDYQYHHIFPKQYFGGVGDPITLRVGLFDHEGRGGFIHSKYSTFDDNWANIFKKKGRSHELTAFNKRQAAIYAARGVLSYGFLAYNYKSTSEKTLDFPFLLSAHLDGVSNVLYNVTYIMSIPAKLIYAILNPSQLITIVFSQLLGLILAVIMILVGFIVVTIFNPLQTLSNLLFSVTNPIDCNILHSCWDLMWGGVVLPVWDIFAMFLRKFKFW